MRNARKVTRRRSVNGGPLGRPLCAAHRRRRRWMRQQHDSSSSGSSGGGKLDVVGYSTPESVYQESLEPAFEKTSAGQGRQLQQLVRRLRRPEPRGRRRPAGLGRPLRPGRRHGTAGRRRRTRRQRLGQAALRRHRPGLGRRDHRPQGQPEGDPQPSTTCSARTSTSSPPTRSAPARRAGTSWPSTAPLINEGKSPDQALEGVKTLLEKTVAQPGSARDALAAFTQGEGDVLLGYENEAIKAENEGEDVEYVVPPSTIQIETPIAVTKDAPEPAARRLPQVHLVRRRPGNLGRKRLPPGQPETGRPEAVPDPEGSVQDQPVRRLGQGQRRILRRRNRLGREDRG